MRISDWSSDVCSSDLPSGEFTQEDEGFGRLAVDGGSPKHGKRPKRLHRPFVGEGLHLRAIEAERSEEHTSELQSLMRISYAVFCLKKNKTQTNTNSE